MCLHQPPCPDSNASDCEAARPVAQHPEQGWSLLCNGVLLLNDTGAIRPDGSSIAPQRIGYCNPRSRCPVSSGRRYPTGSRA
ncbi:DUF5999 family protein [Streptomyces sp. Edi2]|uniref:DUF5999 family protein n=1 Tax=Streptomyces sp. Edi2 TaxID=3162528 RepID=UPI003305D781